MHKRKYPFGVGTAAVFVVLAGASALRGDLIFAGVLAVVAAIMCVAAYRWARPHA